MVLKMILLILITLFLPPVGVFLIAGCGADLLINILLTCLGYLPGHIHAFYLEYMYYKRRDERRAGILRAEPVPEFFSDKVAAGSYGASYAGRAGVAPVQVGGGRTGQPVQQGYGTV